MMTFTSSADLSRLHKTDPAQPVINKLANGLFSESQPTTIALLQPHDNDHPLAELCNAEDVTLEGVIQQGEVFLVALQTDYGYGIVFVVPDTEWLSGELRRYIEHNFYN